MKSQSSQTQNENTGSERESLIVRVGILRRAGVPSTWVAFCAEVWANLDEAGVGIAHVDKTAIVETASGLGKDPIAIVRAVAYLRMAAKKQGQMMQKVQERGSAT